MERRRSGELAPTGADGRDFGPGVAAGAVSDIAVGRHSEEGAAQSEGLLHWQAILDDANPVALAREGLGEAGPRSVVVDEDEEVDARRAGYQRSRLRA